MIKGSIRFIVLLVLVIVCFCFFVTPSFAMSDQMETFKLRVSVPYPTPDQALASAHLVAWEEMVTVRTKGAVTFENFFGGSLGSAWEHLDLCSTGVADIVITYGWYTVSRLPLQDFDYAIPFGPTDPYILTKAMRQIYEEFPELKEELNRNNVERIFQSPGITELFLSKNPITSLDGMKGQKIYATGRYFGRWIEALGGTPVSAPSTELYTMLQTDVVDMAMDTTDLLYAYKIIELIPHCLHPKLLTTNWISCLINLDTLNKMPKEIQNILLRTGEELELYAAMKINPEWEEMVHSKWEEENQNHTFAYMSENDRQEWADKCPNTAAEWADEMAKEGLPGWEILERFVEITGNLGHEWLRDWSKK